MVIFRCDEWCDNHLSPAVNSTSVFPVVISPSIYNSCSDRRLLFAGQFVYRTSFARRHEAMLTALLLLLGGIEQNPGPAAANTAGNIASVTALRLGVLNARSAVNKAALIHDIIDSQRIDVLVLTETWMSADQPTAITRDIAPPGYSVVHQYRSVGTAWRRRCCCPSSGIDSHTCRADYCGSIT